MLGDHGDVDKSKPWEGSAHVPLMCAGPGILANHTVTLPVATMVRRDRERTAGERMDTLWAPHLEEKRDEGEARRDKGERGGVKRGGGARR